jgi:hypothetical protein
MGYPAKHRMPTRVRCRQLWLRGPHHSVGCASTPHRQSFGAKYKRGRCPRSDTRGDGCYQIGEYQCADRDQNE